MLNTPGRAYRGDNDVELSQFSLSMLFRALRESGR